MANKIKKAYMKKYNQLPSVKAKKRDYMKKIRSDQDKEAAQRLVLFLSEMGYSNWAEDVALERAPEMLATVKTRVAKRK
mgnify:CR=1 FL=1|jgi:hypothetical protein